MGEPHGNGTEKVAGRGFDGILDLEGERVEAELVRHRQALQPRDPLGEPLRQVIQKLAQVARYRRQRDEKEEGQGRADREDHEDDAYRAIWAPSPNREAADPVHDRHQDHGEEGADVQDFEFLRKLPRKAECDEDREEEDYVAARVSGDGLNLGGWRRFLQSGDFLLGFAQRVLLKLF